VTKTDEKVIEELAAQIRHHRDAYYNGVPEISDAEFDALEDRLRSLAPNHPVLGEVGAPAKGAVLVDPHRHADVEHPAVGELRALADRFYASPDPTSASDYARFHSAWSKLRDIAPQHSVFGTLPPAEGHDWPKARHEIPMGSLNKVNTPDELREWAARCDELAASAGLDPIAGDLAVTEKIDGLSVEVLYDNGEVEAAITRGDGVVGELITANVIRMKGVPAKIEHRGRLSVRGEILLRKSDAEAVEKFKKKVDPRFDELKSLRNMAAGLARTKDPRFLYGCRFLSVLFYDLEGADLASEKDKLALLTRQGFETPTLEFGTVDQMIEMFEAYEKGRRESLDYEIDGLVVRANQLRTSTLLGELNNRPRAAVAFKFSSEMQVTTLLGVLWSTGDSGRITPIAQIEPVFLAGAEVRQASLHNLANVKRLGIGVGDQVLVSRRNDVIPYVEKLMVKGPNQEDAPSVCARCNAPVSIEGEYLVCRNDACPARKVGRLKMWIRELGLLDWGERTLERFFEEGLATEPADLYKLRVADVTSLSGFGETMAKKLLGPLEEKKKLPITIFIAALGIESVSRETAKLLARAGYDTIEKIAGATIEQLSEIGGLGKIKGQKILDGIRARLPEIARLAEVGVVPIAPNESGPLAGLSFCFSGSHSRPRKELEALIEKNGGTVAASVTKGLSYLVLADPSSTSSKAEKARKLGTEVIDEARMEAIIRERSGTA
jgi:DNA ligase (NAD+)